VTVTDFHMVVHFKSCLNTAIFKQEYFQR